MSTRDITTAKRLLAPDTAGITARPHPDSGMILAGYDRQGVWREFHDMEAIRSFRESLKPFAPDNH